MYFCGYCGEETAHGVCVAASTVGATMPSTLWPRHRLDGSHSCCRRRAATAVAVLQPSSTSLQPAENKRLGALPRQLDHLLGAAIAVGDVGVVAEINEGQMRKALDERAQDRETAEAGIEDADHARVCDAAIGPSRCENARPRSRSRTSAGRY